MYEQDKATTSGYAWRDLVRTQEALHTSQGLSTSISIETVKDAGKYMLLCVITAIQSGSDNVPGDGGGTTLTVEYHNVYELPERLAIALHVLSQMLERPDDVPF